MHPAPIFRWDDPGGIRAFVAERAFATVVVSLDGTPTVAQVPVLVDDQRLLLHLSRGNPLARALPCRALLVVQGPDAYVSPDWYRESQQVPTWSYVSAELEGELAATDDAMLREILARQAALFESRIPGKRPWTLDQLAPEVLDAKLKGIVGATFVITALRATAKLSQNKSDADRAGVIDALDASERALDREVAAWMRR